MEESGFEFKNVGHQYCATIAGSLELTIIRSLDNYINLIPLFFVHVLVFVFCFSKFDHAWTWVCEEFTFN